MAESTPSDPQAPGLPPRVGLGSPRFWSFLVTQFLGAANDNAFKYTVSLLILATLATEREQAFYTGLATALFPLPFLLFSPLAGYLADRFPKHHMILITTAPEILAMSLGVIGFSSGNLPFLLGVLFLMAAQSAFFSPVKYGLLPECLERRDLSMANGVVQMTTNLAILSGSVVGLYMFTSFREHLEHAGWVYVGMAVAGTLAAIGVPRTPPGNPRSAFRWNPLGSLGADWREARRRPPLAHALAGLAYYWFLGSMFLAVVPIYGKNVLQTSVEGAGLMLMILSVGIGVGSLLAGRLSHGRVELGLVPLGSLGLTVFSLDLGWCGSSGTLLAGGLPARACVDLVGLGLAAGLFVVPLSAQVQLRSPEGQKGRLLAFSNMLSFSGVFGAAGMMWAMFQLAGWNSRQVVLVCGVMTLAVTVYMIAFAPLFLVRLVLWLLTNTFYRTRIEGDRHLPADGGLLVARRTSWVDALLVGSACDRAVRFMVFRPFYEARGLNWLFRRMQAIPIAANDPPEVREAALARARREIEDGHLVCIFADAEAAGLPRLEDCLERIVLGLNAPILPTRLEGTWGSLLDFDGGRLRLRWPRRLWARVRVEFGVPLPPETRASEVRSVCANSRPC